MKKLNRAALIGLVGLFPACAKESAQHGDIASAIEVYKVGNYDKCLNILKENLKRARKEERVKLEALDETMERLRVSSKQYESVPELKRTCEKLRANFQAYDEARENYRRILREKERKE